MLSHSLLQAARKRPALANMLIHPWLALPTPGAPLPTAGTPLPTPQLQLTTAPSSPGPSPLGLAPTECGPHTPMPVEGRQHEGMSPCTTASEETMLSCEMATPDSRCVSSPLHSFSHLTLCIWLLCLQVSQLGKQNLVGLPNTVCAKAFPSTATKLALADPVLHATVAAALQQALQA